jgi:hypothetical protein
LAYFKRSVAVKQEGVFLELLPNPPFIPFVYGVQSWYIREGDDKIKYLSRTIDVYCTLRGVHPHCYSNGACTNTGTRARVRQWVLDWKATQSKYNVVVEDVDVNVYFERLRSARIVIGAEPGQHGGDNRFWEALASGALLFTDETSIPHPPVPAHAKHVVVYDASDYASFVKVLQYYIEHPTEAAGIARQGWLLARNYHGALNRADYLLWASLCIRQCGDSKCYSKYPIGSEAQSSTLVSRPRPYSRYGHWRGPTNDEYFDAVNHSAKF